MMQIRVRGSNHKGERILTALAHQSRQIEMLRLVRRQEKGQMMMMAGNGANSMHSTRTTYNRHTRDGTSKEAQQQNKHTQRT